jgi:hypothetical protein
LSTHGDMGTTWDRSYNAAGKTSKSMAETIVDGTKLKVKGTFIDRITKTVIVEKQTGSLTSKQLFCVAEALFRPGDEPGGFLRLLFWAIMFGRSNDHRTRLDPESAGDQDMFAAFISSLSLGIESPQLKRHEVEKKALDAQVWSEFVKLSAKLSNDGNSTALMISFDNILDSHIGGQVIFRSAKGLLGVGLPVSQDGDIVCIVPGHATPLLLRSFGQSYQLVSTCYVQGLMDGEAIGDDENAWLTSLLRFELA